MIVINTGATYAILLSVDCSTHMQDLQEVTQEVHYENYRSERLAKGAPVPPRRQT